MGSDIGFLETICERMQQVGLVQSKADFSTRILGKGPSYLTSMSARDRNVPDEVMTHLAKQLQQNVTDNDAAIARLNTEAKRHEHERKHRVDMIEWIARHQGKRPAQQLVHEQTADTSLFFGQRHDSWFSRGRAALRFLPNLLRSFS